MKEYNGHRSWNAWNVSLWIGNTENIYNFAMLCLKNNRINKAVYLFMKAFEGEKTPDGAVYNHLSVKLCLQGFLDD